MNKRIKYIIIIFAFQLCHINLYAQGTWESLESPTNQFLTSVYFVDSLYGWAVGDSGTIIHSNDGGINWVFQNSETENKIVDVFFLNRNFGWASSWNTSFVPFGTLLLKTTNGGQNWIGETYMDDNLFMTSIHFHDSLNGWMGGKPHALVKTTDGGVNWQQGQIDSARFAFFPILSIRFYNSQYGYACGGSLDVAGIIWRTMNGGDNWFVIDSLSAPPDPVKEFHTLDSLNVIGIGGDPEFRYDIFTIRTSNGGVFWEYEYIGIPGVAWTIDFRNDNEAWSSLGNQQMFIYSLDSGVTWIQIPTPDSSEIFDVIFPDSLHGFAVGREGAILKYKPPIVDDVSDNRGVTPESFGLFQNYPNPFNPSTKIKYSIPSNVKRESSNVSLKVYDILGNKVATLVNEEKPPGEYEIEFSVTDFPSSVYFYQLQTEGYIKTKKMLLVK
jgi:photosystem II stability/assembly factor-like uncharacterized protein